MKNFKDEFKSYSSLLLLLSSFATSAQGAATYVIRPGDSLSEIAYRFLGEKVYGDRGGLMALLELNPWLKNPHEIEPGQVLNLEPTATQRDRLPASVARDFVSKSSIGLAPQFTYQRLTSRASDGTSANSISEMGHGLRLDWTQYWSASFSTKLWGSYQVNRFKVSDNRTLTASKRKRSEFGLELIHALGERFKFAWGAGHGTKLYLRSRSPSELQIDEVDSFFATGKLELTLLKRGELELSVAAPVRYSFGATGVNEKSEGGLEFGGDLKLLQHRQWGGLEAGISYLNEQDKFSTIESETESLNIFFGVRFMFGGE